jgi:hypothetical protein
MNTTEGIIGGCRSLNPITGSQSALRSVVGKQGSGAEVWEMHQCTYHKGPDISSHLGKPAQNAHKWFATIEIERMNHSPDWLDKAIRIVEKQIEDMNRKQRAVEAEKAPV